MAQSYFLASSSAHKTLALSNLKRPGPEVNISMTPLLEYRRGFPTIHPPQKWPPNSSSRPDQRSDNKKLFPHSSLYAGPLKLQGTACSLSSAPCRASQPVCHRLPDTTEVSLFSASTRERRQWETLNAAAKLGCDLGGQNLEYYEVLARQRFVQS